MRLPNSELLKRKLRSFEESLQEWGAVVERLKNIKPSLVWGLGRDEVVKSVEDWTTKNAAFMEQGWKLLEESQVMAWSILGKELDGLTRLAKNLCEEKQTLLGVLESAVNPEDVVRSLGLELDWLMKVDADLEDLDRKLQKRARLLCPWTLRLGEEGELRH